MLNPKPEIYSAVEFSNPDAGYFAPFLNRAGRSNFRSHTVHADETQRISVAADNVRKPLTDSRYSPR